MTPNQTAQPNELLTIAELAKLLKRSKAYIYLAKKSGMPFIANRITLTDALSWLKSNPDFKSYPIKNK